MYQTVEEKQEPHTQYNKISAKTINQQILDKKYLDHVGVVSVHRAVKLLLLEIRHRNEPTLLADMDSEI